MAAFAVFMLMVGWYFKNAVTRPLEILTRDVDRLGHAPRGGEGSPVDAALLRRGDEIGDLAVQFSRTFQLLVEARRALQEESRAEISLQRDRLHGAIENMPQGLYMLDRDGRIIVANRRLIQIYNLADGDALVGLSVQDFIALCRGNGAGVKRVISDETQRDECLYEMEGRAGVEPHFGGEFGKTDPVGLGSDSVQQGRRPLQRLNATTAFLGRRSGTLVLARPAPAGPCRRLSTLARNRLVAHHIRLARATLSAAMIQHRRVTAFLTEQVMIRPPERPTA